MQWFGAKFRDNYVMPLWRLKILVIFFFFHQFFFIEMIGHHWVYRTSMYIVILIWFPFTRTRILYGLPGFRSTEYKYRYIWSL